MLMSLQETEMMWAREIQVLSKATPRSKEIILKTKSMQSWRKRIKMSSIFLNNFGYLCFDTSCVYL